MHNHLQAQQRRDQYPEFFIWETDAGSEWLMRLVFAALFQFGLRNQVGAGQLSEFFRLIHIDTHVGVSESSLRTQLKWMETLLATYQQQCEASATAPVSERVVAMDETFFQQYMILVMMDLSSGYILLEQTASDRSFDTWQAQTNERLKALGLTVRHAISDRAKALIKLATQGFGCASGADLFHGQYELSQWLSRPLGRATELIWQQWCEDKVPYFQRTSSAVEGRNGGLSQLYHNGRGLTERRLTALTVIHNYAIRRPDGSTPASRLFGQKFPDVFEWLLSEMGTLPLPRRKRKRKAANALIRKK